MNSETTFFDNTTTLLTGGSGSFGHAFVERLLGGNKTAKVIVYSRDEFKQYQMKQTFATFYQEGRLSFVIGDVRNRERLASACYGVDFIVHAAALKQVPTCEENIEETVLTNVHGALNVRSVAEQQHIKRVIALSTDKAVMPVNLYGATKMVSDKVFTDTSRKTDTIFSIVRYGNVATSRGSVIPLFQKIKASGVHVYPITDMAMTRFWISLPEAVDLAMTALKVSTGGETFVAKLPSFLITELAKAIDPACEFSVVGIRPGEKIHETMITRYDAPKTADFGKYYVIFPSTEKAISCGHVCVKDGFEYSSDINPDWLNAEEICERLDECD